MRRPLRHPPCFGPSRSDPTGRDRRRCRRLGFFCLLSRKKKDGQRPSRTPRTVGHGRIAKQVRIVSKTVANTTLRRGTTLVPFLLLAAANQTSCGPLVSCDLPTVVPFAGKFRRRVFWPAKHGSNFSVGEKKVENPGKQKRHGLQVSRMNRRTFLPRGRLSVLAADRCRGSIANSVSYRRTVLFFSHFYRVCMPTEKILGKIP